MKNLILFIALSLPLSVHAQTIQPAPFDKSVVYFVRASDLGALINFTYFDSTKVIGRFNGPKYLRYECEPGNHLFWGRSENKDFVQANLDSGKIYVIDVIPQMGIVKAGIKLVPVNSSDYKIKKIQKLLAKKDSETFSNEELLKLQQDMYDVINRGMEKHEDATREIKKLNGFTFTPEQLTYVKD